jgi:hypothetical protein
MLLRGGIVGTADDKEMKTQGQMIICPYPVGMTNKYPTKSPAFAGLGLLPANV